MSIKEGNKFLKEGHYDEAIEQYKLIPAGHPLYKLAQINIKLATLRKNDAGSATAAKAPALSPSTTGKQVDSTAVANPLQGEQPLVSVVMPVFNVAPYLDASIMSVLDQSYQNIELIIVNDASTDNSINIIHMHEAMDDRIKVIDLEFNTLGGAGIPSNVGIDASLGKYLAFADSDDILDKQAVEKMVALAEDETADVIIANFALFNDETRYEEIAYDTEKWKELPIGKSFSPIDYPNVLDLSPVPWRKLYLKSFLDQHKIRYPEGDYFYEDNPLHWMVLSQAQSVALLDHVVALHRMEREGQTMGSDNYKMSAMFCHMNTVKEFFQKEGNVSPIIWKQLVNKSANYDWVIRKEQNAEISNMLKKRNSQLLASVLEASGQTAEQIGKARFDIGKKIADYGAARKDIDLTIIIPIYNCEDLIESTLESLTKINGISYEVLMMDDGSTDSSYEICKSYADKYDNFLLFRQKNRGAGVARNALIPLATGKYCYFLDSDDTLNVEALKESLEFGSKGNYDLVLFKYRIHFFDKNSYNEMFNSDKKIWAKLLKATTNAEKQQLAAAMINYPWIRIIKTSLLHDENIFFGKTVVHNDIPYHWHSIVSAKNIGIFDEFVCDHRKFETRSQITNIVDARRMMVFEAHRYTQHLLERYNNFATILPVWKTFITNLFNWASSRIPQELSRVYENKKIIALVHLDRIQDAMNGISEKDKGDASIGLYRIIGNAIPGLHNESQANTNLAHIVKNESDVDGFHKHYVLNRIVDEKERETLIAYLEKEKASYIDIPFDIEEYKKCGYDLKSMPDSYFWFRKAGKWVTIVKNTSLRNFKNQYLMNNNGARNTVLLHGKERYDWTMPWDGNCFLSDQSFNELKQCFNSEEKFKYVLTPMERVAGHDQITAKSVITNAVEEPQISFRQDSLELFNEDRVYGNQPKVELFKRIGFHGVWDEKVNIYPWRKLQYVKSPEAGQFVDQSAVFRLYSGNTTAATNGENRSHARGNGIINFIDSVEAIYAKENYEKGEYRSELLAVIEESFSIESLSEKSNKIFSEKTQDINAINSKDRAVLLIYSDAKSLISHEKIIMIREKSLYIKDNVELKNKNTLLASISNTLSLIIVNLAKGEFCKAVENKINMVMLYFFYFDNKSDIVFTENDEYHFTILEKASKILFSSIFEYDLYSDMKSLIQSD